MNKKERVAAIAKLKYKAWFDLAEYLGLCWDCPKSGTSHSTIRKDGMDSSNPASALATIYPHMPQQAHNKNYKAFIAAGYSEKELLEGLRIGK